MLLPTPQLRLAMGLLLAAIPAAAQQIILTPGSVIGGSGAYSNAAFDDGSQPATRVADQQTGPIAVDDFHFFWLAQPSVSTGYVVLDLGAAYRLGEIDLFNTHNGPHYDFGSADFHILASNSITEIDDPFSGYNLTSGVTILSGTLSYTTTEAAPSLDVFIASNSNLNSSTAYRYISFNYDSIQASGSPLGGGLNEIRVMAIPETATWAMLAGVAALGLAVIHRRRRLSSPNAARA